MEMNMDKLNDICDLKDRLISEIKMEFNKGMDNVDAKESGLVVDMIKDLAEAEKSCYEACYYKTVIEAMNEGEEPRYGYNNRRYMDGRYAPRGSGHISGYDKPFINGMPYVDAYLNDPMFDENMRRGYDTNSTNRTYNPSMSGRSWMGSDKDGYSKYGTAYDEYKMARKHYTDTHSSHDKEEMDMHANEHVMSALTTVREIYDNAEPELKKRIKSDFTKLVSEMTV